MGKGMGWLAGGAVQKQQVLPINICIHSSIIQSKIYRLNLLILPPLLIRLFQNEKFAVVNSLKRNKIFHRPGDSIHTSILLGYSVLILQITSNVHLFVALRICVFLHFPWNSSPLNIVPVNPVLAEW